jgi:MFS family permease
MPLYVQSLGIGAMEWGALAAAWALGMFLVEWMWGSLSDTADRRRLMLISALTMSVLFVLFTVRALIPVFLVLELLSGAMGVAIGPTTRSYVADESPKKSIGFYASLWWTFFMLGQVVGAIAGSFIAQAVSFECSFYTSSIFAIALAVFIACSFPADQKSRRKHTEPNILSGLKLVLKSRSARLLFLSAVLIFIGRSLILDFLPLYAGQVIHMSILQVGVLLALISGTQLVSMPALGWVSDRFGRKRTAVLSYALSAFLFLLYFFAKSPYQMFLVSFAVGVGLSGLFLLLALIPTIASSDRYGKVIGTYGSFEDLGVMIGPILYGFVWSAYAPVYIFLVCSLAELFAAALVMRIDVRKGR